jgi:hypothetical protein
MITFEKNDEAVPICPHCKKDLTKVLYQQLKGDMGKRCVYFCPECKCCIGVSQRKGIAPFGL